MLFFCNHFQIYRHCQLAGIVPVELMEIQQPQVPPVPQFSVGESREEECQICFSWKSLHLRTCCKFPACDECMEQYCSVQVKIQITSTVETF